MAVSEKVPVPSYTQPDFNVKDVQLVVASTTACIPLDASEQLLDLIEKAAVVLLAIKASQELFWMVQPPVLQLINADSRVLTLSAVYHPLVDPQYPSKLQITGAEEHTSEAGKLPLQPLGVQPKNACQPFAKE